MSSYVPGAGTERPKRHLALTNALLSSLRIRQQMRKDIFLGPYGVRNNLPSDQKVGVVHDSRVGPSEGFAAEDVERKSESLVYRTSAIGYGTSRIPNGQELGMAEAGNTLTLETTQGTVVIEMRPDLAPGHVEHIKKLVSEKFYDGIVFHRVIDGFMAQTGCPHGTGTGGSKYPNLKAEFNAEPHVRGTCSMARAQDPNSANSQFFICFADARFLDRNYTVWGKVVSGMENVDKIKRGEPVRDPDKIITATSS